MTAPVDTVNKILESRGVTVKRGSVRGLAYDITQTLLPARIVAAFNDTRVSAGREAEELATSLGLILDLLDEFAATPTHPLADALEHEAGIARRLLTRRPHQARAA